MHKIQQKIDYLYAAKRYKDAEEMAHNLTAKEPGNFWAFCKLSQIYIKLEEAEKAVEMAKKAVSINPEDGQSFRSLGWSLHFAGNSDEASKAAKQAIRLEPSEPENYNLLGWVLARNAFSEEALNYIARGLELAPEHVGLWNSKIRNLINRKDWDGGIEAIQHTLSLDSNKFFTFAALGGCYYKKKDFKRSEKYLVEALKIIPSNKSAQDLLHEVRFRQKFLGRMLRALFPKELEILP